MIARLTAAAERLLFGALWLAVTLVIAFGSAGIAAALDHQPGTDARPELTWAADAAVDPELDAAIAELREIADLVDELGRLGRGALAAMAARDFEVLDDVTTEGGDLVAEIDARSRAARSRVAQLEGFGPGAELILSASSQARHEAVIEGTGLTSGLSATWTRVTFGSLAAARLSGLLATHDERITAAIEVGRQGEFDTALERIGEATAALDEADALRDQLATTTDVSTLDEWLRRNRNYDEAVRRLYEASAASPDRVTPELRTALREELEARRELPETTDGLTIVMADIGRGGLNQAVITIEEARGRLTGLLAGVTDPAAGTLRQLT